MRFLRRSLVGLFLVTLTVGILALAAETFWRSLELRWAEEPSQRRAQERVFAVNVVRVEPETVTPILSVFGEVRSRRTLELRATSAGRVVWLADAFEEGGQVEAGELLVRIDPAEPQSALKLAEAGRGEAEAEVTDAERAIGIAEDDRA
jgi:multidrug efflux pump subunit AcrA (membrane-fusion protein)